MSRHRIRPAILVGAVFALGPTVAAGARENSDTLRVADAIAEALSANPRLASARHRADAAAQRAAPAGALPEPMLMVGLMNRPIDFGSPEPMTMNSVQLSQRFPWPGRLGDARRAQDELALSAALEADETAATVVARVTASYYRIAYLDRAIRIMGDTRALLGDLLDVAEARYEVGTGLQQDLLQAQVAVARMDADIRMMRENRTAAAARFNALLGRAATGEVGTLALPEPGSMPDQIDELMATAAARRPALSGAHARVESARAMRDVRERAHLPDFNVTLGYAQRPSLDDFVTLMVGVSLPLRQGSIQAPQRREAAALLSAEEAMVTELYNETYAALVEERARATRAAELHELYRTRVIPQSRAAVEAGLSAYRVGSLDFMSVLDSQMTVNRYEIESVRLAAEHQEALAGIGALTGISVGGDR